MEEELVARLLAKAAISAIVGASIHWGSRPDGEDYPGLVLQIAAANRQYDHDGPVGLQWPRVQIDAYAETYGEAKLLSRVVVTEMEKPHAGETIYFEDAILVFSNDADKENLEGGTEIFRVTMDFTVPHRPV